MGEHLVNKCKLAQSGEELNGKSLLKRAMGRFYTHEVVGRHLAKAVVRALGVRSRPQELRIVEPFAGDGRLVCWLLEELAEAWGSRSKVEVCLWENDVQALGIAGANVRNAATRLGLRVNVKKIHGDTFLRAGREFGKFDACITNPPWENLKPDRRELEVLSGPERREYVRVLRERDEELLSLYTLARPLRKFSGWGTNLARCGTEASFRLTKAGGVCGVVAPASTLGDQSSNRLREWLFCEHQVSDVAYFEAEARLFERVDQTCVTIVAKPGSETLGPPNVTLYGKERKAESVQLTDSDWEEVRAEGHVLPVQFGLGLLGLRKKLRGLPRFDDLEHEGVDGLWAGRELDETNHAAFVGKDGKHPFIKGRMVARFGMAEQPTRSVRSDGPPVPKSVMFHRLVWRDVSRPNQKRRLHATIIPPGWVTGNSLHVAYFRDDDLERLQTLLGIVNSLVFESQARAYLSTGHVSLGAVRRVRIPDLTRGELVRSLSKIVRLCRSGATAAHAELEVRVAQAYGLTREDFASIVSSFPKLESDERAELLNVRYWHDEADTKVASTSKVAIPNHYAAKLSDLDLVMVRNVPPGGNWKDIPKSVPSQRLAQIRESYAAGEGSRSTYYGRLRPDAPAYTINTYFGRPGNGCHLHYDFAGGQHRTISHREAARFQSFPDDFVFHGSRNAVAQQIGNAVPPILAFVVAKTFGEPGMFVDLFCGAGGLGLGFIWAGWRPVLANDIEESFLQTYRANVDERTVRGDIRDVRVFDSIVMGCERARKENAKLRFFILGGPPCQGFSTAGNRRSMEDERNWLFKRYVDLVRILRPEAFVFENVPGLMNMDGGRVFEMVKKELEANARNLAVWKLRAEEYGVPQRRSRVVVVGECCGRWRPQPPVPLTQLDGSLSLFGTLPPAITASEALSDLPRVKPGEDGSALKYLHEPESLYQKFMRGHVTATEYVDALGHQREKPYHYKIASSSVMRT